MAWMKIAVQGWHMWMLMDAADAGDEGAGMRCVLIRATAAYTKLDDNGDPNAGPGVKWKRTMYRRSEGNNIVRLRSSRARDLESERECASNKYKWIHQR